MLCRAPFRLSLPAESLILQSSSFHGLLWLVFSISNGYLHRDSARAKNAQNMLTMPCPSNLHCRKITAFLPRVGKSHFFFQGPFQNLVGGWGVRLSEAGAPLTSTSEASGNHVAKTLSEFWRKGRRLHQTYTARSQRGDQSEGQISQISETTFNEQQFLNVLADLKSPSKVFLALPTALLAIFRF